MKTKFLAGLVASLIALVFVVGAAILMVTVFDLDSENKFGTYTIAFACIAMWLGIYRRLKPKEEVPPIENDEQSSDRPRNQVS